MKKLLITGGSHSELPLIEAAQAIGWFVISTGNDEGNFGHLKADKYVKGDFSDKNFIYELAKSEKVDAIISGCNDFAYLSAAYACEKLNLPGHDTFEVANIIHTKSKFRELLKDLNIKTPQNFICHNLEECLSSLALLNFPVLIKPVDLTGGKGVRTCYSEEEIVAAYTDAIKVTRKDFIILEEFVQGSNHGITTLIKDQKVVWYMVDNEQYGINKYLVLGASAPSDIPQHSIYTLINDIEKIANKCKFVDGLFHTQFILDLDDYPVMIDPCRRSPGDLYILLAKFVTGVDYPLEIVKAETGIGISEKYKIEHNYVARECIMSEKQGYVAGVNISDNIEPYIVYKLMKFKQNEYIDDIMKYKAGILIMKFDSYEKMNKIVHNFSKLASIEFKEK